MKTTLKNKTFDSMRAASAALNIPFAEIRRAKADGCPAFRCGRVYAQEFMQWHCQSKRRKIKQAPRDVPPVTLTLGHGAALQRLEQSEADTFSDLNAAIISGDPDDIARARRAWLAVGDSLRKNEISIAESKRGNGEMVSRGEVERLCAVISHWQQSAFHQLKQTLPVMLEGCTKVEIYEHLQRELDQTPLVIAAGMATLPEGTLRLPPWVNAALTSRLDDRYRNAPAIIEDIAQAIKWTLEYMAQQTVTPEKK